MGLFDKFLTSGATDLVESVGEAVGKIHTSKEEKANFLIKFQEMFYNYHTAAEAERSERWKADMTSDSWMSKNIRPMTLAVMLVALILFTFLDTTMIDMGVKTVWVDMWGDLAKITFAAYFGSRGYEKGQEFGYKAKMALLEKKK